MVLKKIIGGLVLLFLFVPVFLGAIPSSNVLDSAVIVKHPSGSYGSGFLVSPNGHIITNEHVACEFDDCRMVVETRHRKSFTAKILKMDKSEDLALLKIDKVRNLPYLRLGNHWPNKGDKLVLLGYGGNKRLNIVDLTYVRYENWGTHEGVASKGIVPGDSGGAILDIYERVIGVGSALRYSTRTSPSYTLFVPVIDIKRFIADIDLFKVPLDKSVVHKFVNGANIPKQLKKSWWDKIKEWFNEG